MGRTSKNQSVTLSAESDEWGTPRKIIALAREVMGSIDTDPCSCELANTHIVKATTFYDIKQNGLTKRWRGNVWLNPAFTVKFQFAKLADYYFRNRLIDNCFFLTSLNSAATQSMQCFDKYPMCIYRGRLNFVPLDGQKPTQNTVNTAIFYLSDDYDLFDQKFSQVGNIRYPSPKKLYIRKTP